MYVILTLFFDSVSLALVVSPLWTLDKPAWFHLLPGYLDHGLWKDQLLLLSF